MTKQGHARDYVGVRLDPDQTPWFDAHAAEFKMADPHTELTRSELIRLALRAAMRNSGAWMPKVGPKS